METIRVVRILCILAPVMMTGCATITSNEMQPVSVTTKDDKGQILEKAKCNLRNDKGAWDAESPAVTKFRSNRPRSGK